MMASAVGQSDRRRWLRRLLSAGLATLVLTTVIAFLRPTAFFYGYLSAFLFWSGLALGGAGLLLLHLLTGGRWGWSIRAPVRAAVLTLPIVAVAWIPVAIGASWLYPWMHEAFPDKPAYAFRAWYLQAGFFYLRAVLFLGFWVVGAFLLLWLSVRPVKQDGSSDLRQGLAALGMILYFITVTFAGIDWILSLEAHFYSSIFGLYIIIGQALTALAAIILIEAGLRRWRGLPPPSPERLNDLGTLLLAFIILHTYIAFSQFFIIWNGNLPHHVSWYVARTQGGWGVVALVLMVLHFFLPFFALLFRALKQDPRKLTWIAMVVLAARVLDSAWMVLPSAPRDTWLAVVLAGVAMLAVGGLWTAALLWRWPREPAPHPEGAPA